MTPSSEDAVRRFYDARKDGDLEKARGFLAEDVTWLEPGDSVLGGEYEGRDVVLDLLASFHERSETFDIRIRDLVANDDHVVAILTWEGERNGRRIQGREAGVYRVRDGRIEDARFFLHAPEDPQEFEAFWA